MSSVDVHLDDTKIESEQGAPAPTDDFADVYDRDERPEVRLVKRLAGEPVKKMHPRVKFILDYIHALPELTFVYERDLADAGLLPYNIDTIKRLLKGHGLELLHPRRRKISALIEHYKGEQDVPLRLLFFNSPVPAKFERIGVSTLGPVLSMPLVRLNTSVSKRHRQFLPTFDNMDLFEIQIVLDEAGYRLAGTAPIQR